MVFSHQLFLQKRFSWWRNLAEAVRTLNILTFSTHPKFSTLPLRIVTLQTLIIRIINFSSDELYLPFSKSCYTLSMASYIPNFNVLASLPKLLPHHSPIKWYLGNANHFKLLNYYTPSPQLVISTKNADPFLCTPPLQ